MPKAVISKKWLAVLVMALLIVTSIVTMAFLTDRVDHSMQFTTASFNADTYKLTRTAPVGPFCAGEQVTAALKESNTGSEDINSVISMKATWVSPDTALSIFGNANAADNAKLSIGGTDVSYTVSADKKSIAFDLPAHVLEAGAKDKARDLTLTIPESFTSTGRIDFTFEKVVVKPVSGGFTNEYSRTELNASSQLDYSAKVGWAASSITEQSGKALMGYLTEKDSSGKYGIEFDLEFNYTSSPMKDFSSRTGAKWSYYKGAVDTLTFVEGMTSIGDYAFPDFSGVKSVSFPATVKTVGVSAFDASGLTGTVTIPATVKEIKSLAFGNLPNVKTFTFGHGSRDTLTLPDNTAAGKRNTGAFYVSSHVDTTVNSSVEAIQYGYKWHDGYDNRRAVPTLNAQDTWFRTYTSGSNYTAKLDENVLKTVTFADYHMPVTGETSWDASDPSVPGTVTAYLSADKTSLILAGNGYGLIFANKDSSGAFSNLPALETVSSTDLLDTRNVTTMADMFNFDRKLANISVSTWNVSKVENMSNMFYFCDSLPSIDLKKNTCTAKDGSGQYTAWNTAALKNTSKMFMDYSGTNHALTTVDCTGWDTSKLEDASYMFMECRGLTAVKGIESWNVSSLKTANNMFQDCRSLESINVANWKTTSLENTSVMFSSCHSLRSIDITRWDMSKVTKSNAMFSYCECFTELTLPKSLVVVGEYFAANCPKLTTITFNQPAGTNIQFGSGAFNINNNGKDEGADGYIAYTPVKPLGTKVVTSNQKVLDYNWTSDHRGYKVEIKTVEGGTLTGEPVATYNGSKAVVAINGKTITFTATCKDSDWVYEGATIQYSQNGTAKTVTLDKNTKTWVMPAVDDKANEADVVVTPKWKIVGIPMLAKQDTWQTDGGTEKIDYDLLETINIVNKYTPAAGETAWSAAANETVDGVAYTGKVTAYLSADKKTLTIAGNGYGKIYANPDSTWAFTKAYDGMPALKKIVGAEVLDTQLMVNAGGMFAQNRNLESVNVSGWNTGKLQKTSAADGYYGMFMNCAKLKSLNVSNWNTKSVTEMSRMFSGCSLLSTIDVSKWNTSSCVYMNDMFYGAGISQIDMTGWDTGNLKYTYNMFKACASLTGIDLSTWDTSKLENCSSMFEKCEKLTSIELAGWNTAKVTDMSGMFYMCTHLPELYISSFNTRAVEDMENMFLRCDRLQKVQLGKDFLFKSGEKGYLPTPDSNYIPGTDGKWYVVGTKVCYTPAELAPVVRVKTVTYVTDSNSVPGEGDVDPTIQVIEKPTQKGTLTYNGETQYPEWNNYEPDKMTMGGVTSGVNAGSYVAKFTPKTGYCWKDGTADTIDVTWKIGKAPGSLALSKSAATIDYNASTTTFTVTRAGDGAITVKSSNTNIAAVSISGNTVTVTKKVPGTATITVSVAEGANYLAPADKTCKITCIGSLTVPSQKGTLTYTGGSQTPTWNDYNPGRMNMAGTTSGTNAGSYTATFTPKTYYKWSDGTSATKSATWKIGKAPGSLSLSKYTATIDYNATTTTFTVNRLGDGAISVDSLNPSVADAYVRGTTVTVTKRAAGTATIVVRVAEGTNYLSPGSDTCDITCIEELHIPSQTNTLTYNGGTQRPTWSSDYSTAKMTVSGTTSGIDAGSYPARFTPKTYYKWYDGTTNAKTAYWRIGKAPGSLTLSKYAATIDYNATTTTFTVTRAGNGAISAASSDTNIAAVSVSGTTVTVTKKAPGAATITVKVGAGTNHLAPADKTCEITCIGSLTIPSQKDTLTYNGSAQTPSWNNYDPTYMTMAGTTSGTNAGSYTATFTPKTYYKWSDGADGAKDVAWKIGKAPGSLSLSKESATIDVDSIATTFTVTRAGDGEISAKSSDTGVATVSVSGTTVTVTKKMGGSATITVSVAEGTNHLAPDDKTCEITCKSAPMLAAKQTWYKSSQDIATITRISFKDSYTPTGTVAESWDASAAQDGGVTAYRVGTEIILAGNGYGKIYANPDSSTAFKGLSALTAINGLNVFDTSGAETMRNMFAGCEKLTSLDVTNFDTAKVNDMSDMFNGCGALTSLNVSKFDTSKVMDMSHMFTSCWSLRSLNLSAFDTSSVEDMEGMFSWCNALTSLDVSKFDTSQVENMAAMFAGCNTLTRLDLSNFDTAKVRRMDTMFIYCSKLTSLDVSKFDTSQVYDMNQMFMQCAVLPRVDVSKFNTSQVTNMSSMFSDCKRLASLDVSGWDTAKVEDMSAMFRNCNVLNGLDVSGWDTSRAYNMGYMFQECYALSSLDVSEWNTSSTRHMRYLFSGCRSLTSLDVSKWDTSSVFSMEFLFDDCWRVTSLDVSKWDTSQVTDMFSMFHFCYALTNLDVSKFDTSQVRNMGFMFAGCKKLTSLDLSNFNTYYVDDMAYMFNACEKLTSLDLSSFDTRYVNWMTYMFSWCSSLKTIYVSESWTTSNVWTAREYPYDADDNGNMITGRLSDDGLFIYCYNLRGAMSYSGSKTGLAYANYETGYLTYKSGVPMMTENGSWANFLQRGNVTKITFMDSGYTVPDGADVLELDVSANGAGSVTMYAVGTEIVIEGNGSGKIYANPRSAYMFSGFSSLTEIEGLALLDTSKTTDMEAMFLNCYALTSLDLSSWNTANVRDMKDMFRDCLALTSLDLSGWDTSKVSSMTMMFSGCSELTDLNVSMFNTWRVNSMKAMFQDCSALTSLDLSSWNTAKVTTTENMFNGCSELRTIYASDLWTMESVRDSGSMFVGCSQLSGAISYDSSKVDGSYANYTTGYFKNKAAGMTTMSITSNGNEISGYSVSE